MSMSKTLKFFQFVAVKTIIDYENDETFRDCIFANATKFDKTIVAIIYFQHVSSHKLAEFTILTCQSSKNQ